MRSYLFVLIALLAITDHCRSQEKDLASPAARTTNSLSSLEALLVGTWRWDLPAQEKPNVFMTFHLSPDRSWSYSMHSDPRIELEEHSDSWFVHERILVLRMAQTNGKLLGKFAWACDIKSVDPKTIVLTNSPLGDMTWKRIAQQDGPANRSQPVGSGTNRPPAAAGSGR
jgi:hypothetical protein